MDGSNRLVVNTLERAVSTDINRMQSFKDAMVGEFARYFFGVYENSVELIGGVVSQPAPGALSPYVNHGVVNGLLPKPINGTLDMLIEPGLLFTEDAAYTPANDSFWRYVKDPGVTTTGVLTLTTGSPGTRIDVIECQYVDTVIEQDNRDIFNPSTGLFTPTLVDKVKAGRLQYRIRTGTSGAGFPGVVAGWMPLAVASVPNTATSWDDVTLYDVRNLVSKYHNAPFASWKADAELESNHISAAWDAGLTNLYVTGKAKGRIGQFMIEGYISNHPTNATSFNAANHAFWQAGLAAMTAGAPWYVYACFPFGLPFWRKYNGAPNSPRRPAGMCGVLTVSQIVPTSRGLPNAVIPLPTATGLGGSTQFAIPIAAGLPSTTTVGEGGGFLTDGQWTIFDEGVTAVTPSTMAPAAGSGTSQYNYTDGALYPGHARACKYLVTRSYTVPALGANTALNLRAVVRVCDAVSGATIATVSQHYLTLVGKAGDTAISTVFIIEVPHFLSLALLGSRRIEIDYNPDFGGVTPSARTETATIIGWKIAD
jgi:hypothetical protein